MEKGSGHVADGTEAQDSVWSIRDQRNRDTQDSELSLTLLCYTDAQDHESTDQTSDCNAEEQQTPLKMCSIKLEDCRNLIESREEETTAEQQQQSHEEEDQNEDEDDDFSTPKQSMSKGDWEQSSMILTDRGYSSERLSFFVLSGFLKSLKYNQIEVPKSIKNLKLYNRNLKGFVHPKIKIM